MNPPTSLRDLYIDPNQAWAFVPPTPHVSGAPSVANASGNATASASTSSIASTGSGTLSASTAQPAYQWSTRPSSAKHNSIFDLSPGLDLSEPAGVNAAQLFRAFVASAVLRYTSTAIVMPWEVGKLLLQVQWVPRDAGEVEEEIAEEDDNEDALSDDSGEGDSYFADPNVTPTIPKAPAPRARTDSQGYIIRRSVLAEGTRPEYIIPVGSADGVWGMMKRVGRFRFEGWLSLWKGLLTSCITEVMSDTLQPMINGFLQSLFFPSMSPFHSTPIILPVVSHLITGFLLSPLDLIRTRLIVQSFTARYKRYSGPLDALQQILRDEGGVRGIYLHPQLLIPTILDNALRPIVSFMLPGMVTSYFGYGHITEDTHPIGWGLAELTGSCVGLLITLPVETIRRRLQVQTRGTAEPVKGCVELRPAPYNGVVDTFWHILTEERSDLPITRSPRRRRMSSKGKEKAKEGAAEEAEEDGRDEYQSWLRNTGLGQLYRGLGMRLGASAVVFALALVGGGDDVEGGWAEI
ncbi:mitochondrial carrier [Pholiota conissans]|uniref:Mitochondrial carrier n=1 Tax=Pholiota conissans TaxID=109636 RepID=A0A9P5Z651_9AGAR|nr:mitochondrial carrier [Pholiota conissans]